jgi:hypothetical protein
MPILFVGFELATTAKVSQSCKIIKYYLDIWLNTYIKPVDQTYAIHISNDTDIKDAMIRCGSLEYVGNAIAKERITSG